MVALVSERLNLEAQRRRDCVDRFTAQLLDDGSFAGIVETELRTRVFGQSDDQ